MLTLTLHYPKQMASMTWEILKHATVIAFANHGHMLWVLQQRPHAIP